ncbi:MAG: 30S ribosomal protein S27ae [Nitrososphaerota archaeon]
MVKVGKQAKLWRKYKIENNVFNRKVVFCPRCGEGYVMAEHPDRFYCGNCHFTKFKTGEKKE